VAVATGAVRGHLPARGRSHLVPSRLRLSVLADRLACLEPPIGRCTPLRRL